MNRDSTLDAMFFCFAWIERFDAIKQIAIAAAPRVDRWWRVDLR
jgi:hypothetical protein